jgi:hypothetical protein
LEAKKCFQTVPKMMKKVVFFEVEFECR